MGKLNIKESIEVNTSAEKAWEIIGPNFLKIEEWGRGIKKSWNNDDLKPTFEGAPAGGRFCDLGKFGVANEQIIHYSIAEMEISWTAGSDKLPKFLKNLQNALKVTAVDDNLCIISTNITANLSGLGGIFLGGPIKKNFSKLLRGFVKDWKTFAETGEVSQTKARELASYKVNA